MYVWTHRSQRERRDSLCHNVSFLPLDYLLLGSTQPVVAAIRSKHPFLLHDSQASHLRFLQSRGTQAKSCSLHTNKKGMLTAPIHFCSQHSLDSRLGCQSPAAPGRPSPEESLWQLCLCRRSRAPAACKVDEAPAAQHWSGPGAWPDRWGKIGIEEGLHRCEQAAGENVHRHHAKPHPHIPPQHAHLRPAATSRGGPRARGAARVRTSRSPQRAQQAKPAAAQRQPAPAALAGRSGTAAR